MDCWIVLDFFFFSISTICYSHGDKKLCQKLFMTEKEKTEDLVV